MGAKRYARPAGPKAVARTEAKDEAMVRLEGDGMTLVDFASAGGNDPENDTYTVFVPKK